jgi:predicted PurR-regulated permease PerM
MKLPSLKNHSEQKVEIVVANRTVIRVMVVVTATVLGFAALNKLSSALILIFIAFFLAVALNAPVHWIAQHLPGKRKGSRTVATSISFLFVVVVLLGFLTAIVPPAISQVNSFVRNAPELISELRDEKNPVGHFVNKYNLDESAEELSKELSGALKTTGKNALSTASTVGNGFFSLLTVLVMTFMMLVEAPRWIALYRRLLPDDKEEKFERLRQDMYKVVKGYVNGQATLAAIAALVILPAMLVLHVPYAGALAVIIFICGLIPMFGHFIGAAIVTTLALFESPVSAVAILSFYILYQQIENYVVQPRIQANATNMSPLLVFIAVILGVNLNGIVGGLVAIPVAGCLRIILLDYLKTNHKIAPKEAERITGGTK